MNFNEMDGAINKILLKDTGKYLLSRIVTILMIIAAIFLGSVFFIFVAIINSKYGYFDIRVTKHFCFLSYQPLPV